MRGQRNRKYIYTPHRERLAYLQTVQTIKLTPWNIVHLEKPTLSQLVKEFPAVHGRPGFITVLTKARQMSISRARSIQSSPVLFLKDPFQYNSPVYC